MYNLSNKENNEEKNNERRKTMTIWEVQKYGKVVYDFEHTYDGVYRYNNMVYYYNGKYFAETWCTGYRLSFCELI